MERILLCVRKYSNPGYVDAGARRCSFPQLGFSVHLCRHMASQPSDGRTVEKWWITLVDRRTAEAPSRTLVLNEWLGNQHGQSGRMGSVLDSSSSKHAGLQELMEHVRQGSGGAL